MNPYFLALTPINDFRFIDTIFVFHYSCVIENITDHPWSFSIYILQTLEA